MRSLRTKAIVLRRTNYGEADRILQLLTPEGRYSAMARGARRERSKLAGGIELFGVSDVVIGKGRGDIGTLTSARLIRFFRHILEDYDSLQFAYEAVKQIGRASQNIDEPEWFDLLLEVLTALDDRKAPLQLIETWFYIRYANLLGYALNLQQDTAGDVLDPGSRYSYDVSEQGLRKVNNGEIGPEHIKLLRLVSTKSLETLSVVGGLSEYLPVCLTVSRQHASV